MSKPFTRDEAMSAVWAQVEDFEPRIQIVILQEVLADMMREYPPLDVQVEMLKADFEGKALNAKGVHSDAWAAAAKAVGALIK